MITICTVKNIYAYLFLLSSTNITADMMFTINIVTIHLISVLCYGSTVGAKNEVWLIFTHATDFYVFSDQTLFLHFFMLLFYI